MLKRTITSAGIIAVTAGFLALRLVDKRIFDIFLLAMALIGTFEYHRMLGERTKKAQEIISYAFCVSAFAVAVFFENFLFALTLIFVAANLLLLVIRVGKYDLNSVALTVLGGFYPTLILIALHFINVNGHYSNLILAFVVTPFADAGAYLIGSAFGGKKLCPTISPHKTISGAIGGLIGAVIASLGVYLIFGEAIISTFTDICIYAAIGLIAGALTEIGDLVESRIKREIGIKDTGNILPGHGGMLDRIDGLTYATVALYAFFSLILPIL